MMRGSLRELGLELLVVLGQGVELLGQGGGGLEPGEHDDQENNACNATSARALRTAHRMQYKPEHAPRYGVLAAREPNPNIMNVCREGKTRRANSALDGVAAG